MIEEFVNKITSEVDIHSGIIKFDKTKHVLECICKEGSKPYETFLELQRIIDKRNKAFKIVVKVFQAIMAIFGVNDLYNALKDLSQSIFEKKDEAVIRKKEAEIFNNYVKFIERKSKRVPLIIFIKKAQWIDEKSIKLVEKLLTSKKSLWGMIILEFDELEQDHRAGNIRMNINELVAKKKLERIFLKPLGPDFPAKLLEVEFGPDFLNSVEKDILFAVSQGNPGMFISLIERSLYKKWIYKDGNRWTKKTNFKELVKPKFQQLVELICTYYSDHELSERELQLIRSMATAEWDFTEEFTDYIIQMVKCIMNQEFNIFQILEPGVLSNCSFIVFDKQSNRYIIEYLTGTGITQDSTIKQRNFKHGNLLDATEIRITKSGVLIIWNYVDAIETRNQFLRSNAVHVKKEVEKIKQISRGLLELHRQGAVHGFIKPESIFKTKDDTYFLVSFDISLLYKLSKDSIRENWNYLSPEQLEGRNPKLQSDIFSLGVLFYECLTASLPFTGNSKEELLENIKKNVIQFNNTLIFWVPDDIQNIIKKCLKADPSERYNSVEEFYEDLRKIDYVDYSEIISSIRSFIKEERFDDAKRILGDLHDQQLKRKMEDEISAAQGVSKKKSKISYLFYTLIGIVVIGLITYLLWPKDYKFKDYIAIQIVEEDKSLSNRPVLPAMLEFLIIDDISQNSNRETLGLNVLSLKDFNNLFPESNEKVYPRIHILGKIINGASDYELTIQVTDSLNKIIDLRSTASDPLRFLADIIPDISQKFFRHLNIQKVRNSTFTNEWDAFVNFFQGEEFYAKVERDLAVEKYQSAIAMDPDFILAKLRLVNAIRTDYQKASQILETIWNRTGELSDADSLKAVALNFRLKGNLREALTAYKKIIDYRPANKESFFDVAEVYFDLREIEEAKKYYLDALRLDSDFTLAINHLAYCYSTLGKHDEAIKHFSRYVDLDSTANSYDSMGDGFAAAGLIDSAIWAKRMGISLDNNLEYIHSSLAYINFIGARLDSARQCLEDYFDILSSRADTNYQQLSTGYFLSALLDYTRGSTTTAINTSISALTMFDSNILVIRDNELHWLLALLYFRNGNNNQFLTELDNMDNLIATNNINSTNYNAIFKFRKHLEAVQAARAEDFRQLELICDLFDGQIKYKVKDHTSIFDLAFFNNSFGELYLQRGRLDLAKERFIKALDYNPNFAVAHYHLSEIYRQAGETNKAEKELAKFNELWGNPDMPPSYFVWIH